MIPLPAKSAASVAKGLGERVCLSHAGFPTHVRSDNAQEFVGDVISSINELLGVKHITGSAYHPQSQGMIERMHKTMNAIVRGLVQDHPEDWEARLPLAEFILRTAPMEVLGGRTPYQVVMGFNPTMPRMVTSEIPVQTVTVSEYSDSLQEYFRECYTDIQRIQREVLEDRAEEAPGRMSAQLEVGDTVVVKRIGENRRDVPSRFLPRTIPGFFTNSRVVGKNTFDLVPLSGKTDRVPIKLPVNADRLIKVELPRLDPDPKRKVCLERYDSASGLWSRWRVERVSPDGSGSLRQFLRQLLSGRRTGQCEHSG